VKNINAFWEFSNFLLKQCGKVESSFKIKLYFKGAGCEIDYTWIWCSPRSFKDCCFKANTVNSVSLKKLLGRVVVGRGFLHKRIQRIICYIVICFLVHITTEQIALEEKTKFCVIILNYTSFFSLLFLNIFLDRTRINDPRDTLSLIVPLSL